MEALIRTGLGAHMSATPEKQFPINKRLHLRFQVEFSQETCDMNEASDYNVKRLIDLPQELTHPDARDELRPLGDRLTARERGDHES